MCHTVKSTNLQPEDQGEADITAGYSCYELRVKFLQF